MPLLEQETYISYNANGTVPTFAYPFKIVGAADIVVKVAGVVKTLTTHYALSGIGAAGGGNVTFVVNPTGTVELYREVPYNRETDYAENGDLIAQTLDDDLDRIVMQTQQLKRDIDRAVAVPHGWTATGLVMSTAAAAKMYVWGEMYGDFNTLGRVTLKSATGTIVSVSLPGVSPAVTVDLDAAIGANGPDAAGVKGASKWIHIWLIYNPATGVLAGLASVSATAPTLPSGYTYQFYVGANWLDGAETFITIEQRDNVVMREDAQAVTDGVSTDYLPVDIKSIIPRTAKMVSGYGYADYASAAGVIYVAAHNGMCAQAIGKGTSGYPAAYGSFRVPAKSEIIDTTLYTKLAYKTTNAGTKAQIYVTGWEY